MRTQPGSPPGKHAAPLSVTFECWFGIPNPGKEYSAPRPPAELLCLTPEVKRDLRPQLLHELASRLAAARSTAALARLTPAERRDRLRRDWAELLGDVTPPADPVVQDAARDSEPFGSVRVERIHLRTEPGIVVPVLLLRPTKDGNVPHSADRRPGQSEPLGGLLALFGALFEDDVRALYVHGGLSDDLLVLEGPLCYLPYDAVVPGALAAGDLDALAAVLAPRPLWPEGLVDGLNREVPPDALARRYEATRAAYAARNAPDRFRLGTKPGVNEPLARWLSAALGRPGE